MRNIKLVLQYDGTGYLGWQSQRGGGTIQQVMEERIFSVTGQRPKLLAAGRTDAGAHAMGQVASFRTDSTLSPETMARALNALLPPGIRVISASEADDAFHPRFDCTGKVYFYLMAAMGYTPAFLERYVWRVPRGLETGPMRRAGRFFIGRHDFRAFMGAGSRVKDTVREVRELRVEEIRNLGFPGTAVEGRFIAVTVEGDGFLRHMVRNIVGTLVEAAKGTIPPESITGIIASGDRGGAGPTAPAKGLFLREVQYPG
jgi:tRNA pseudouridine38-40 synthase